MTVDATHPRQPAAGSMDQALVVLACATLLAHVAIFASLWPRMPDIVPMHFNAVGAPDGHGPRAWLFLFPALAAATTFGLLLVAAHPRSHNLPVRVTPANEARVRAISARMVRALCVVVNGVLGWGFVGTARVALGLADGLGPAFLVVSLVAVAAVLAIGWVAMGNAAR